MGVRGQDTIVLGEFVLGDRGSQRIRQPEHLVQQLCTYMATHLQSVGSSPHMIHYKQPHHAHIVLSQVVRLCHCAGVGVWRGDLGVSGGGCVDV